MDLPLCGSTRERRFGDASRELGESIAAGRRLCRPGLRATRVARPIANFLQMRMLKETALAEDGIAEMHAGEALIDDIRPMEARGADPHILTEALRNSLTEQSRYCASRFIDPGRHPRREESGQAASGPDGSRAR
jgi:hypothetical protein